MRVRPAIAAVVLLLTLALAAPATAVLPTAGAAADCVRADARTAAATLIDPNAELVEVAEVGGLSSALVLEPLIAPGTRRRLVKAGDQWCTTAGFNTAWAESGQAVGTVAQASAFASVAAAEYFDGVTIKRAEKTAPGVVTVDTHALTNGVTATWTIVLDGRGIRSAAWTATGFAVKPFEAEIEGVTALPGLRRTYLRNAAGSVIAQQVIADVADLAHDADPSPFTTMKFRDGFTIEVHESETPVGPNLGQDTGVTAVDYIRIMASAAEENYNDFLDWGLQRSWANAPTPYPHGGTSEIGIIYVDSAITAYCLACVWIRDDFQIHMSTAALNALNALGYSYPGSSDRDALSNVIGHEMFHNWQNAYGNPGASGESTATSFSEGTARMQETLHAYSHISHQSESLVYANDSNGCNGWDGSNRDAAFAAGPFTGQSYDACYFWLTWYGRHGTAGLVDLLAAQPKHIAIDDANEEELAIINEVTGDVPGDLTGFAAAALTKQGYTWPAGDGTGEPLDWSRYLDLWRPATIAAGGQASATLRQGGILARRVTAGAVASLTGDAQLALVRQTAEGVTTTLLANGTAVPAPPGDENVWLLAFKTTKGSSSVTLRF